MTTNNYSTDFCSFIAKIWFLLFFLVLNSKFTSLLIAVNVANTNQIQREFHSNVRIATFETSLASKQPRQKTNFLKQNPLFLAVGTASMPSVGLGLRILRATNILFLCIFALSLYLLLNC
jgi:hypothetical protein